MPDEGIPGVQVAIDKCTQGKTQLCWLAEIHQFVSDDGAFQVFTEAADKALKSAGSTSTITTTSNRATLRAHSPETGSLAPVATRAAGPPSHPAPTGWAVQFLLWIKTAPAPLRNPPVLLGVLCGGLLLLALLAFICYDAFRPCPNK